MCCQTFQGQGFAGCHPVMKKRAAIVGAHRNPALRWNDPEPPKTVLGDSNVAAGGLGAVLGWVIDQASLEQCRGDQVPQPAAASPQLLPPTSPLTCWDRAKFQTPPPATQSGPLPLQLTKILFSPIIVTFCDGGSGCWELLQPLCPAEHPLIWADNLAAVPDVQALWHGWHKAH